MALGIKQTIGYIRLMQLLPIISVGFLITFNPAGFMEIMASVGAILLALLQVAAAGIMFGLSWLILNLVAFPVNLIIGFINWLISQLPFVIPQLQTLQPAQLLDPIQTVWDGSIGNLTSTVNDLTSAMGTYVENSWFWDVW